MSAVVFGNTAKNVLIRYVSKCAMIVLIATILKMNRRRTLNDRKRAAENKIFLQALSSNSYRRRQAQEMCNMSKIREH